ncbi:MAG: VWA domain-containing protein [Mariprofundaceae bacterium]|nr:VWA domain-containing protein [Mariprofundaceae bacterium]
MIDLSMLHIIWPWVFVLLPLPWFVYSLWPAVKRAGGVSLYIPFADDYRLHNDKKTAHHSSNKLPWPMAWAIVAWCLLLLATARPEWVGDPINLPLKGRDLMLAVDLSGSMQIQDFTLHGRAVDRLTATKAVADVFIREREGDRIGLILFGSKAYIQSPLTFDRQTVNTLLQESAIGLAGKETAIGDAIGLAVKRLREQPGTQKVLILLTDGVNTAGELKPRDTAALAADSGIRIYTIGIGADSMLVSSFFGNRQVNPSADLDEKTLTAIAKVTGGQYFRARDSHALQQIYAQIDQLEPSERDQRVFRPVHALYVWPLALAMLIAVVLLFIKADVIDHG